MRRTAVVAVGVMVVAALGLGSCAALAAGAALTGTGGGTGGGTRSGTGSGTATGAGSAPGTVRIGTASDPPAVPVGWESLAQGAAATCPGLSWGVLAAIGRVESDSGQSTAPGVASGANAAGAEGPMQFEPATFATYAVVGPGGATPPSPYDPIDAVYTAAAMLCADGAGTATGLYQAVWDYNHTAGYVESVLVLGRGLGADPALGSLPATALVFAASQLGVPYVWGGTGPDGYDCSGLVQAAYRAAGVSIPRVTQAQFDAGPAVPPTTPPEPGDLLFFGTSTAEVTHVGIYVGVGDMIDAPHTGTVVQVDMTPTVPGQPWGTDRYLGATRPGGT